MSTEVRSGEAFNGLRRTRSLGDIQPPRTGRRHRDRVRHSQHPLVVSEDPHSPISHRSQLINSPSSTLNDSPNAGSSRGGIWSPPPVMMQHMEEAQAHHRGTNNATVRMQRPHNLSWYSKILAFFGYGRGASHQRRLLVSLLWNLALGFAQFVVIVALLAVAATTDSPTSAGISEWAACNRPLGAWCCLWIGRVALACILTYWGWVRDRDSYQSPDDVENTPTGLNNADTTSPPSTSATGTASRRQSVSNNTTGNRSSRHQTPDGREMTPPRPLLYTRLSLLSSLVTLSWFLTAHILEYTSVNTCRFSSPHLWWLVFSILCLMYIMVLEVVLIGFVVFIIAPILFLFWNILLMCLGRHPLQNPGLIKPEIGKLPRSVVDRIPLVMYIPPSPEDAKSPITIPEAIYTYPPKEQSKSTAPKRRFRFLRRSKKSEPSQGPDQPKNGSQPEKSSDEPQSWEDQWEHCEYPFVKLEGNRAACAICLMDFEEPKRINGNKSKDSAANDEAGAATEASTPDAEADAPSPMVQEIAIERPTTEADQLKLTDAGDGAQPLRLLGCGHVFHKTCLDPWLTDVSGRCPVCQRPVEMPETKKKGSERGRRS